MRFKFNCATLLATMLFGFLPTKVWAEAIPLIVPEATFSALPRVTGNTLNQGLMDQHSTVRIQLKDRDDRLRPDTSMVIFRQGLRLSGPDGRQLGVLAVPIAQGQTLSQQAEADAIADPGQPGVAWARLRSLHQEVLRGDSVMTQAQVQAYQPPPCKSASDADSVAASPQIIALISQADMISSGGDLVVASGGCAANLVRSGTLTLWRPAVASHGRKMDQPIGDSRNDAASVFADNPAITRTQTPGHRIGTATVVTVYPDAAILRVKNITQPVQPGDLVRISPVKTSP